MSCCIWLNISEKRRIGGVLVHQQSMWAEGAEEKLRGDIEPRVRRSGSVLRSFLATYNVMFGQTISPFCASDSIPDFCFTPSHLDFWVQRRKQVPPVSSLCHVWIEASCRTGGWLLWVKGGAALAWTLDLSNTCRKVLAHRSVLKCMLIYSSKCLEYVSRHTRYVSWSALIQWKSWGAL